MHLISAASGRSIGSVFASRLQRRTFAETRRLTAAHGVRRIWIRRGITYFHVKDNTPSLDSLLSILRSVSPPSVPSHLVPLFPQLTSGGCGSAWLSTDPSQFSESGVSRNGSLRVAHNVRSFIPHVGQRRYLYISFSTVWIFWPSRRLSYGIWLILDPST